MAGVGGPAATEATHTLGEEAGATGTKREQVNCVVDKSCQEDVPYLTLKNQIREMSVVPMVAQHQLAGRLTYYLSNWQVLTRDQWVLNTVQG